MVSAGPGEGGSVTVVQVFGGERGEVVDGFVWSFGVQPGHPVQDGCLEVITVAPGSVRPDQFGLEDADLGLGQVLSDAPYEDDGVVRGDDVLTA